jgi:hypothetical protein
MSEISPSIADLYRAAANPLRTRTENIHVQETPFVSSNHGSDRDEEHTYRSRGGSHKSRGGSTASHRSDDGGTTRLHQASFAPPFVQTSDPLYQEEETPNLVKSYVSRRSNNVNSRIHTMRENPYVQEERQREKTHYLHELNRMKMNGSLPSRDYTEEDDVADLAFECSRIKSNEDMVSMVSFMKDAIKLSTTGVELLNNKFNLLRLSGWSREVTRDMERYNRPLSKIYQRYWRKGSVSPFIELAFLLGGSLVVHHFKNLLMGGGSTAPPPAAAQSTPAPSRNVPFNFPPAATAPAPPRAANTAAPKRPPMRRPMRAAKPAVSKAQPPENLIEQILQGQHAHQFSQEASVSAPGGMMAAKLGGMAAMGGMMGGNVGMVVIDVQQGGPRRNMSVPEVEVVEENSLPALSNNGLEEHRIDIREVAEDNIQMSSGTNGLSFDMA